MSDHGVSLSSLPLEGEKVEVSKFAKITKIAFVVGAFFVAISLGCLVFGGGEGAENGATMTESFAYSWLFACYYFFTIAAGGLFFVLLHHASNSGWGIAVRRVMEHLANMLPYTIIFFIPILIWGPARNGLYEWMALLSSGEHNVMLENKAAYLNPVFFAVRILFYFIALSGIARLLRAWSLKQDETGEVKYTFLARRWSCALIPVFAISVTFIGIDLLMCLDFVWFSTMWGVYLFAGSALSGMAVIILTVTVLRSHGYLGRVVTMEHYHIMGKLMFAFTVFWAYISFSQFFLYWYAKITEETKFYILRNTDGWYYLSLFLVFGHFVVPFVFLLRQQAKKDTRQICMAACWVLFVHMIDIYWIVIPERGPSLTQGGSLMIGGAVLLDIVAFLAVGGMMIWLYLRSIGKYSIYPCRDPRLLESARLVN